MRCLLAKASHAPRGTGENGCRNGGAFAEFFYGFQYLYLFIYLLEAAPGSPHCGGAARGIPLNDVVDRIFFIFLIIFLKFPGASRYPKTDQESISEVRSGGEAQLLPLPNYNYLVFQLGVLLSCAMAT